MDKYQTTVGNNGTLGNCTPTPPLTSKGLSINAGLGRGRCGEFPESYTDSNPCDGSLSNDNSDGNENGKKAIGID